MRAFISIYKSIMVQAISLLTLLRMLTEAQTSCNFGAGRIVYEKLPNQQLQGFDDDVVRDSSPPMQVLAKCQDLCLRDRTAANNLVRTCSSIDFQPGKRLSLPSGGAGVFGGGSGGPGEYEESICYLSREQARPEGLGTLVNMPGHYLFSEVCLSSSRIERECPNRKYVFERTARKRFRPSGSKEYFVANRTECEDKCLNEYSFVCRSISYDGTSRTCSLSRFTRRTHPEYYEDDPGFDYLENTCLSEERRCEGQVAFIKEERAQIFSVFDSDVLYNVTVEDCQRRCLSAETYFCRSLTFDPVSRICILSSEDTASLPDKDATALSGSGYQYFEVMCISAGLSDQVSNEVSALGTRGDGDTSPLFADGRRRDVLTAFQRYRNSRLSSDFQTEITDRSLAECLDECLRQASYRCRSAMYSDRYRVCRLSRFDQRDGRLIYDPDYDFYESLTDGLVSAVGAGSGGSGADFANDFSSNPSLVTRPNAIGDKDSVSQSLLSGNGTITIVDSDGTDMDIHLASNLSSDDPYFGGPWPGGSFAGGFDRPGLGFGADRPGIGTGGFPPGAGSGAGTAFGSGSFGSGGFGAAGVGVAGTFPAGPTFTTGKPRCDGREQDGFRQAGSRIRLRRPYVRRYVIASSLMQCERECANAKDFRCQSFNFYRLPFFSNAIGGERENCELSDRSSRELDQSNPSYFETNGDYDYYERSASGDCLDVSQMCSEDGMEFTLRTPEGFNGRIYTYGYYDRCFFRGTGGTSNVLRITGPRGFPDCGTARYGDILTNIVVVQFSEMVQTSRDKRYNLTCLFGGPGEAVVTSGYIGAGSGSPTPIEFLPAQNILDSRVRLLIMYQGRPTTTIAVGDPLTFKLESLQGYNLISDIFATNVIAKDPYTGKSVQLIDRFGCPIDDAIFPSLDRARDGEGLEARFNAFKIPESNFLVFEATVKSCKGGCQPVFCNSNTPGRGPGQSYGRRRRDAAEYALNKPSWQSLSSTSSSSTVKPIDENEEELVMEMLRVYARRDDIPENAISFQKLEVCLSRAEYYSLIVSLGIVLVIVLVAALVAGLCFRRYRLLHFKNIHADSTAPNFLGHVYGQRTHHITNHPSARNFAFFNRAFETRFRSEAPSIADQRAEVDFGEGEMPARLQRIFQDPSEPIYTEPSLFERSRSLRSVTPSDLGRVLRISEQQPASPPDAETEAAVL